MYFFDNYWKMISNFHFTIRFVIIRKIIGDYKNWRNGLYKNNARFNYFSLPTTLEFELYFF